MTKITNRTVLITGGAAGIGKLLAQRCLDEKAYQVILWDINEENLETTRVELAEQGHRVLTYVVDVSNLEDIKTAAEAVRAEVGIVDILFNNAGIVVGKSFAEHTHRDITKTIDINVSGVMHVATEFIGDMLKQQEGHIINIASAAGLIPNPNMSVYAGSKWAVLGWSESLRLEMERDKTGVHITTVLPSYINTGMFDGVKAPMLTPIMEPEYIVEKIIQGVKNNSILLKEPFMVKSLPILRGLLPTRAFDYVAGTLFGVYKTMATFVGKPKAKAVPEKNKKVLSFDYQIFIKKATSEYFGRCFFFMLENYQF
jgi:all-trans-retinol dehydrogenase (NAD+)